MGGGVRIGAPAMTTRGVTTEGFKQIASFLDRCCKIALKVQEEKGKKLKDFELGLHGNAELEVLKKEVEAFAIGFGYPGLRALRCNESSTMFESHVGIVSGHTGFQISLPVFFFSLAR